MNIDIKNSLKHTLYLINHHRIMERKREIRTVPGAQNVQRGPSPMHTFNCEKNVV